MTIRQVSEADLRDIRPVVAESVVVHAVQHEAVAFDADRNVAFSLNLSARAILELCDGVRRAGDIAADLGRMLDLPAESLLPDVTSSLVAFREAGIATWCDDLDTASRP